MSLLSIGLQSLCFLGLSLDCDVDRDSFLFLCIPLDSDLDLDHDFDLDCLCFLDLPLDSDLDCDLNCPPCLLSLFLDSDLDRLLDCNCNFPSFTNLESAASLPVPFLFVLSMACEPLPESSLVGDTRRFFLFFSLKRGSYSVIMMNHSQGIDSSKLRQGYTFTWDGRISSVMFYIKCHHTTIHYTSYKTAYYKNSIQAQMNKPIPSDSKCNICVPQLSQFRNQLYSGTSE